MSARKMGNSWWIDFRYDRQRYRKRSPENSRKGAQAYELLIRQRLARGEHPYGDDKQKEEMPLFKDFVWDWFEKYVKVNNKESEIRGKRCIIRAHLVPHFGSTRINELTTIQVEAYKGNKRKEGLSAKTINNHLGVLTRCLREAQDWLELKRLPRIKRLKVQKPTVQFFTFEECERLIEQAEGVWRDMIIFALGTGMRLGEIRGAKWEDINWENTTITVQRSRWRDGDTTTKSGQARHVPLDDRTFKLLLEKRQDRGYIFTIDDQPLEENRPRRHLRKICERAGLRILGWHKLRHSYASHLAIAGVPLQAIQRLLGHSHASTTEIYAHLCPSVLTDAVKTLDLIRSKYDCGQQTVNKSLDISQIIRELIEKDPELLSRIKQKQDLSVSFES